MSHVVCCFSRSHDVLFNDCVGVAGVVLARAGCLQISVAISLIVFEIVSIMTKSKPPIPKETEEMTAARLRFCAPVVAASYPAGDTPPPSPPSPPPSPDVVMISTKRFSGKQPASLVHGTRALRQIAVKKELLDAAADPLPSAPLRKEEGSPARWKKLNPKLEAPGRLKTNENTEEVLLEQDVKPEVDDNESNQTTEKKRRGKDGKMKGKSAKEKRKGKDGKKKRRGKEEEAKPEDDIKSEEVVDLEEDVEEVKPDAGARKYTLKTGAEARNWKGRNHKCRALMRSRRAVKLMDKPGGVKRGPKTYEDGNKNLIPACMVDEVRADPQKRFRGIFYKWG